MTDDTASSSSPEQLADQDSILLDLEDVETLEEADPEPARVSYAASDFDVEGLVRRLGRGDVVIPTFGHGDESPIETARFQRGFVWTKPQMDRFIESLLLGYPIPGIFLVQQVDKRYLVLDGQQRLSTLAAFYSGIHNRKEFALQNVAREYQGLTYRTLGDERRRTLDNTFIQATIVQAGRSGESLDAVYQVFERLNSGGTQLTPHEIRVALYAGPFVELFTALNADNNWRALYGNKSPRLRDQEVILRIIALYVSPATYKRPLKKFLNDFVGRNRYLENLPEEDLKSRFSAAAKLINEGVGREALRRQSAQINTALTEAMFVGLMRRLDAGPEISSAAVAEAVASLLSDKSLEPSISRATADEESVRTRLALATRYFARI